LIPDLAPFRAAISAGVPLVMISSAVYPSLGSSHPAVCSPAIVQQLLRHELGFRGVAISDALETPAVTNFYSTGEAAVRAISSGVDMVLAAGTTGRDATQVSKAVYLQLILAARLGQIPKRALDAAYTRVVKLKGQLRS